MNLEARSFLVLDSRLRDAMIDEGKHVHTDTWQGRDIKDLPQAAMTELLNVTVRVDLRGIMDLDHWRQEIRPSLPWADDHFLERVSGEPLNPPPSWAWWPWNRSAANFREGEKFNHTYPERFWPKRAGHSDGIGLDNTGPNWGIRGVYGDLNDVVALMKKDPFTRQAYLPIFFPEDTGIGDGGRKPCTLGYQFIMRGDRLHCFYPMRSCDLVRHFRDDAYLAVRLMIWMSEHVDGWPLGSLTMHLTSLHVFVNDVIQLREQRDDDLRKAFS